MIRFVLLFFLCLFLARALWRLADGVVQGFSGRTSGGVPERGVEMVRDPMCGTYVIPERAVALAEGGRRLFFCSATCRDKYRARTA